MKAIGILGGTFDPIHLGHLITARAVLEKRNLQKIIFVPCFISPHKQNIKTASSKHRLEMVKLSVEGCSYFDYSDYELVKEGVSYTIDTLKYFKQKYEKVELIIGYDNLVVFDKWHKPETILKLTELVVMKRNIDKEIEMDHTYWKKARIVETPHIDISSSDIRERLQNNLPVDYLVPRNVKNYIEQHSLYK